MKINFPVKLLGSGFFTGYMPFITGTFGSLAGLIIYSIPGFETSWIISIAIILFFVIGIYAGTIFEREYGKDPSQCTIDEIVGMWITLFLLPKTILISLTAFIIWRLLDIIKPFPAARLEHLPGGLGVMMDDVMAGIYSCLIMHLGLYIFN